MIQTAGLLAALLLMTAPSRAATITGRVLGQITSNNSGPDGYPFAVGETIDLSFSIGTIGTPIGGPGPGERRYSNLFGSFTLLTGSGYASPTIPRTTLVTALVVDRPGGDGFSFIMGGPDGTIQLGFGDPTGSALSSLDLPTSDELLGFPGGGLFFVRETTVGNGAFRASIAPASVDAPPVPEPSTLAMGLVGLGIVGVYARRRRKVA